MTYEEAFRQRINSIRPGGWEGLEEIGTFPGEAARGILREILETGCLAQNETNIRLGRTALARLPEDWLRENLPGVVEGCLFRDPGWEEWEFLRLAEMLEGPFPALLAWWAGYARRQNNPDLEEAIQHYIKQEEGT